VNEKFSRELTVGLRWLDDPLAWTYTTIHTWQNRKAMLRPAVRPQRAVRTVAIVEPDKGIRLALASCLDRQAGFTCIADYSSAVEALREVARKRFDLVFVNHILPDRPGAACLEQMNAVQPELTGLLFSVFEDSDLLFAATPGGASGYMLKRTSPFKMFEPIENAQGPLTRELIATRIREYFQRLVAVIPSGLATREMNRLTPREHEILSLLAKGDLAKEIADKLGISVWTVYGHVKNIFEKLKVHTRTEAVVKFLQK
jgi:DNA-binding NarL/FixJ family response regulator